MESTGVPGQIQVTRSVYERLKDSYEFESRGVVQVKGKGEIETWLLHGQLHAVEVAEVKIRLLGSSVQDPARRQYVSSYLINGTVAIDVGCLGFYGTPQEQENVRHVFLTHSHADHTASLPIFVENAWTPAGNCARIYGSRRYPGWHAKAHLQRRDVA